MPTRETHETSVREHWHGAKGRTFVAQCKCGWESREQTRRQPAENEADDHVVYMTTIVEG